MENKQEIIPNTNNEVPKEKQIISNDPIFNEIQELLTDQEMINKKLIENIEDNYQLELTFPGELILKNYKVKFLLIIPKKYPRAEPELYCLSEFSHPHLCDGRNLINNIIINNEWAFEKIPLEFIINKIPKFIIKYSDYTDKTLIIGKYTLNHLYPINFLKNLPIFFHLNPQTNKIITISDISLCLYDLNEGKDGKFCKLSFFINIKEIIEIEKKERSNMVIIKYKIGKSTKKLYLNSEKYNTINDILKEKMKIYKKKLGKIPDIDIIYLEKEIEEKEKELLNKENKNIFMYKEKCLRLMDLYQQAIEYYSAVNNPKFIDINKKIHKLIEEQQLTTNQDIKKQDNIDNKNDITNKKEEIIIKSDIKTNKEKVDLNIIKNKNDKNNTKLEKESTNKKEDKKEEINNKDNKEEKENKKKENKNKDNKSVKTNEKNDDVSLRLKIDEGELNTLDVGEDEEEEEEENK